MKTFNKNNQSFTFIISRGPGQSLEKWEGGIVLSMVLFFVRNITLNCSRGRLVGADGEEEGGEGAGLSEMG